MYRKDFLRTTGSVLAAGLLSGGKKLVSPEKKSVVKPVRLKPGDTVGFIAPASIIYDKKEFRRMENIMNSMELEVVFGEHVQSRYGYFSGTDEERAADINRFFQDPDIDGIMAVRGGWGSNRLLPFVNYEAIRENPKFFCGFSDITSLHLSIHARTGLVTFHGPNGISDWSLFTRNHFRKAAFGRDRDFKLVNPVIEEDMVKTIIPGKASGRMIGGNLTLVSSLAGSGYLPEMKGAILFLEDVEEDVYRVDRMLSQLHLCGILSEINGFVFGRCTNCQKRSSDSFTLYQVLKHYLDPLGIPSFYGSMISHEPNIFTIPVGIPAEIDAEKGSIHLLESPVI
ncbi:MAG: LD-carboxypeptidase [Balneolaceae bacterium]